MKMNKFVPVLFLSLMIAGCGKGDDEIDNLPEAPERKPMALDPNPPLSASDIDAIVSQKTRGVSATAPDANTGNDSGAKEEN